MLEKILALLSNIKPPNNKEEEELNRLLDGVDSYDVYCWGMDDGERVLAEKIRNILIGYKQ